MSRDIEVAVPFPRRERAREDHVEGIVRDHADGQRVHDGEAHAEREHGDPREREWPPRRRAPSGHVGRIGPTRQIPVIHGHRHRHASTPYRESLR
jgi:hypothetical protein